VTVQIPAVLMVDKRENLQAEDMSIHAAALHSVESQLVRSRRGKAAAGGATSWKGVKNFDRFSGMLWPSIDAVRGLVSLLLGATNRSGSDSNLSLDQV